MKNSKIKTIVLVVGLALAVAAAVAWSSNHREAPITALDHKADITDVYAFVSYTADQAADTPPSNITLIMGVDPLLEPANGPTLFPFDPNILYELHVDNDHDARADVTFQFRFETEFQLPGVYTAVAGIGEDGAFDPNTGALVVPPQIRDFSNPGLNLRQTYRVAMLTEGKSKKARRARRPSSGTMTALPSSSCPAMPGREPWTTKLCSAPVPTVFRRAFHYLPAPLTMRSGSIWEPLSTPRTFALWGAVFRGFSPRTKMARR